MTVFQRQITDNNDDATERDDGSSFDAAGPVDIRASTAASTRINAGLRFPNVTIPAGSTINSATITLEVQSTANDDFDCTIFGNDVDDAANFVTEADVTSRVKTTASVPWTVTGAGAGPEVSPDISAVIQEIIDRAGWVSGQAMCPLVFGDNAVTTVARCDNATGVGAILDIDYTAPAAGSSVPVIQHHRQQQGSR